MTTKAKPAIWLSGFDLDQDIELFAPDTPSPVTVGRIAVFQISTEMVLNSSDSQLRQLFSELKARGIALCVSGEMVADKVTPGPGLGYGVEGCSFPGTMLAVAQRIASLGGDLQYVVMDEPLYYAHEYEGAYAPQSPIAVVAQQVAESVAEIRSVFPNVQIGDGEPIPNTNLTDLAQWMADYKAETGTPLAFMAADVDWNNGTWKSGLEALAQLTKSAGVPLNIFFDGNSDDQTGLAWVNDAESHIAEVEADPALASSTAYISSWNAQPTKIVPETDLDSLTHLVTQFDTIAGLFASNSVISASDLAPGATAPASNVAILGFQDPVAGISVSANSVSSTTTFAAVLTVTAGTLSVTQLGAATVSGDGSNSVTIEGNLSDVNSVLATVTYLGNSPGNDTIKLSFYDDLGGNAEIAIPVSIQSLVSASPIPSLSLSAVFQNVYGRPPTSTELSALNAATQGQVSFLKAQQGLVAAAQTQIGRLYLEVLGRAPDPGGLLAGTDALLNGRSLGSIRQAFAFSAEVQTDLQKAYSGVYGTTPTSGQLSAAEMALASGSTLLQVEAPWRTQAQSEINQLYLDVQGREGSPSDLSNGANALLGGRSLSQLRTIFATSSESQQRLTNLYKNLMGYTPSQQVLTTLENQLTSGSTIQAVTAALQQQAASTAPSVAGVATSQIAPVGNTSLPFATATVSDNDPNEVETAFLSISGGGKLQSSGPGTLTQNATTWTMTGSASNVQSALRGLKFATPAGSGASTLWLTVTDGTGHAASGTTTITAIGSATASRISGIAPATHVAILGYTDTMAGLSIAANTTTANAIFSATLTDTNGTLKATQDGSATVRGSGSAAITLTGDLPDINAELASIAYTANSAETNDTIQVSFSDSRGDSVELSIPVSAETVVSVLPNTALTLSNIFYNVNNRAPTALELAGLNAATQNPASLLKAEQSLVAQAQSQIASLYLEVHGRNPDPGGLLGGVKALLAGRSLSELRTTFATSSESQQRLTNLYKNLMGYTPSQQVLTTLENQLASGSTIQAVTAALQQQAASTAPSVAGVASSQIVPIGNTSFPFAAVTISDSDPSEVEMAVVSVSGGDKLQSSGPGTLTQNATTWTMTGSASNVQSALRNISLLASNGTSTLSLQVTDGAAHTSRATVAITGQIATGGGALTDGFAPAQSTVSPITTLAGQSTKVAIVGNTAIVTTKASTIQDTLSSSVTIHANGSDNISIDSTSATNVTINGGASRLTVTDCGTGSLTFNAGSGNVTLTGGHGTNAINLGSCAGGTIFFDGNMSVTGGTGPFNWEFTNGNGGTDVIPYKIGHDTIVLNGYGTNRSTAIESNTSSGGNTTLVLSDNTHIMLAGVAHISNNSIVLQ